MNYKVESDFIYKGLRCVVVLQSLGYRCGYVQVLPGHPAYLLDYGDELVEDIEVHGGLTYSRSGGDYPVTSEENTWWFGFDAAHYIDKSDPFEAYRAGLITKERAIELVEDYSYKMFDDWRECRSKEYMEQECRRLADQLVEIK